MAFQAGKAFSLRFTSRFDSLYSVWYTRCENQTKFLDMLCFYSSREVEGPARRSLGNLE